MDLSLSFDFFTQQLSQLRDWQSILDVALVTLIIVVVRKLIQGTRAVQVLNGFFIVVAFLYVIFAATSLELTGLNWLIQQIIPILFLAIPVIFQPELRRAFEQVGGAGRYLRIFQRNTVNPALDAIVQASRRLSQRRHGALIVFEQNTGLQDYVDTGVFLDSEASTELLLTIFNKNTELHDGAVIVRDGKILAGACVLPLSAGNVSDRQMGLRHRAALGISEVSDAVSLIVSEETGQFAITHNGRILRKQDPDRLYEILNAFLQDSRGRSDGRGVPFRFDLNSARAIFSGLISNLFSLSLSVLLALIIWSAALQAENPITSRLIQIPIDTAGDLPSNGILTFVEDNQVRLTVSGPKTVVDSLSEQNFLAYIDQSNIPFGDSDAEVIVETPNEINGLEIILVDPVEVAVVAEQIITERIAVVADIRGSAARGHDAGEVILDPPEILVTGPREQVIELKEAKVTVFLESPREDVVVQRIPTFTNTSDRVTTVSGLEISDDEVQITIPISQNDDLADLPIIATWVGEPLEGYRLIDLDVNPQSVLVTGAPSILENISSIRTVPIDITGATETITQPVALDLPEGISIDEDLQSVIASLIIEPINTSGVIRKTPEIRALGEGLTATIQTEEVTIFLFGSIQALDSLSEDDVTVTLDLFNKGVGTHNVIPVININSSEVEYRSFQPEFVTVIIESPPDIREELEELLGEDIDDADSTGTPSPTPEGTESGEASETGEETVTPTQTPLSSPPPTATPSNYP